MNGDERRQLILGHLRQTEMESVEALASLCGVSGMTVHRDLDILQRSDLVRKVRGGATIVPTSIFEGDYGYRSGRNLDLKQALAGALVERIEPGMALMLDDSSTVAELAPLLKDIGQLTVVTNSVSVLSALSVAEDINLICVGGTLDSANNCYAGMLAEAAINSMRVDLAIFSAACVRGSTAYQRDTDAILRAKHAMMANSDSQILVFDHTKFGHSALYRFADLSEFSQIYVTDGLDLAEQKRLSADGVALRIVGTAITRPETIQPEDTATA